MSSRWFPLVTIAMFACAGQGDGEDTDAVLVTPDPDVDSYVPGGYRPTEPSRLVFLGDSITDGVGASREQLAYPALLTSNASRQWPDHDEVAIDRSFPSVTEVIDVSVGGATTSTMIRDQLPALESQVGGFPASGETIVVYTIGGNDAQGALNPLVDADEVMAETLANMEEIIDWFLDPGRFPDGVHVYLTNVYEPTDGEGQYAGCFFGFNFGARLPVLEQFNADLRDLGEDKGVSVVDLRGHFLGHGFYHDDDATPHYDAADPTLWLEEDCIHPNDRGHHEIRRLFHAAIEAEPLALEVEAD
jgi:lysophospholipase L1-like esterase